MSSERGYMQKTERHKIFVHLYIAQGQYQERRYRLPEKISCRTPCLCKRAPKRATPNNHHKSIVSELGVHPNLASILTWRPS
uniref:Uncharacterized protein n=1 Tax=Romanomermis culicivorax TaxID=13658 RepID=A0A915J5J5_ROMCU